MIDSLDASNAGPGKPPAKLPPLPAQAPAPAKAPGKPPSIAPSPAAKGKAKAPAPVMAKAPAPVMAKAASAPSPAASLNVTGFDPDSLATRAVQLAQEKGINQVGFPAACRKCVFFWCSSWDQMSKRAGSNCLSSHELCLLRTMTHLETLSRSVFWPRADRSGRFVSAPFSPCLVPFNSCDFSGLIHDVFRLLSAADRERILVFVCVSGSATRLKDGNRGQKRI